MKRIVKILIPILITLLSAVTAHAYNVVDLPNSMSMSEALGIFNASEIVRATVYNIPDGQYIELDSNDIRNFFDRAKNMTVYRSITKTPFRGTVINMYTANGAISYTLGAGVQIGTYGGENYVCYKVRGEDNVTLSYIDTMYRDSLESSRSSGNELFVNTSTDFLKLPESDWAKEPIRNAAAKSLLPYELTGAYSSNISREQFCILIGNFIKVVSNCASLESYLESRGVGYASNYFSDCTFADQSVNMLYALGIITGQGDGTFDPSGSITREQAAVIISRAAGLFIPIEATMDLTFSDRGAISDWAEYFVRWVNEKGIMTGVENSEFQPQGMISIEQAVTAVTRLYNSVAE